MKIELSIINIVEILSVGTAFMFGLFFILSKSKNNLANVFLSLFFWSLTTEALSTSTDKELH